MNDGFVYALRNFCMPGIFKIGFTDRHPRRRVAELSNATGVPTPFEISYFFDHEDPRRAEAHLHKELLPYRVDPGREFFALHPAHLWCVIASYATIAGSWCRVDLDLASSTCDLLGHDDVAMKDCDEWIRTGRPSRHLLALFNQHYADRRLPILRDSLAEAA